MTTMIRRILFFLVGIFAVVPLAAQTMSVFSIDATNFPTMRARLIVADNKEQSVRTFAPNDFTITENGKPVTGISVSCPPLTDKTCVNAVMVIDQSLSMREPIPPTTVTRLEAVKAGAMTFLQTIEFTPPTVVALTSFDLYAYELYGFSLSRFPLESKVNGITPDENVIGTNYVAAFNDPFAGAIPLLQQRTKQCPRVIVFLTDGFPYPDLTTADADAIRQKLIDEDIQLYAISIGTKVMHPLLEDIAVKSGGLAFVKESPTVDELKGIYKRIAEQVQGAEPCTITWQSGLGCGEGSEVRKLEVTYNRFGIKSNEQYTAPASSIAELQQSAVVLAFGNPPVGTPVTKQLKLKARNYPFTISGVTFDPPNPYFQVTDWGGAVGEVPPIIIAAGEERTITVTFTPSGTQEYRAAKMRLATSPCSVEAVAVWGGAPPEEGSPIRLFSPNGDKPLSICDTTTIRWGGIPDYVPVRLSYSNDNGTSWNVIKSNVNGDSYVWQPSQVTNQCLVKVETLQDFIDWKWARREGDLNIDRALGLGVDGNNNSYLLGEHSSTIQVDTFELKKTPRFLARYTADGKVVWAMDVDPASIGLAVSREGDSYILGHTSITRYRADKSQVWKTTYPLFPIDTLVDISIDGLGNCWVGGITTTETGGPIDDYGIFIRKYDVANGQLMIPSIERPNAKVYSIAADASGNVVIAGYFLGKKGDKFGGMELDPGYFMAKFSGAGTQLWVKNTDEVHTSALACDKDGNILHTGFFAASKKFGSLQVTSSGGQDMFIAKYTPDGVAQWVKTGGATGSSSEVGIDVSADASGNCYITGLFEKSTARLRVDGKELEGKGQTDVFLIKFKPTGTVEWMQAIGGARIDSVAALGVDLAGKCYVAGSFEASAALGPFNLTSAGQKDAFVACLGVIPAGADLSDQAFAVLAPEITVKESVFDMGSIAVGSTGSKIFQQVICNTGSQPVHIETSKITGTNAGDFKLISNLDDITLEPGECRTVEMVFQPSAVGARSAVLEIEAECVSTIKTPIAGTGLNPCLLTYQKELPMDETDVGVSITTPFDNALCNTGTETIAFTITLYGPGSSLYQLTSPATVSLAPGECYDLTVKFTPDQAGEAPVAYVRYVSECGSLVAELSGQGVPVPPVIQGSEVYCGDIECPGVDRDTMLVIYNLGKTDLLISNVTLAKNNQGFTLLSWPAKIAPQQSDTVRLNFAPATPGFKLDSLVVTSNASNGSSYSIPVSGKLYDVRLSVPANLAFGTIAPRDLPVRRTITVTNTGDATITLTAASLTLANPFVVVGGVPAVLKPGESTEVEIEFTDAGTNGIFNDVLTLTGTPSCTPWTVDITGSRSAAAVLLSVPALVADPHDRGFRIPVRLKSGDLSMAADRQFVIEVKYNDALFFVKSCSNGRIIKIDTLGSEHRIVVTVQGTTPSSGTVLTELVGDVLLGDTVETPIEVAVVNWEDVVGSVEENGTLRLVNTTDNEGLERLIRDRGRLLGIGRVQPNPANTEAKVLVNTVEIGEHVLEVYDTGGRRIYHVSWVENSTSLNAPKEIVLPVKQFPVGSFNLVLKTPTRTAEGRLVVIH